MLKGHSGNLALPVGGIEGCVHILHLRSLRADILLKKLWAACTILVGKGNKKSYGLPCAVGSKIRWLKTIKVMWLHHMLEK